MIDLKSAGLGLAAGLAITAAAAQAMQTQPHDHQKAGQPADRSMQGMQGMQGMDHGQMMADPAMRRQMMERMRQCHEMMGQMMTHMEQSEHGEHPPAQPR